MNFPLGVYIAQFSFHFLLSLLNRAREERRKKLEQEGKDATEGDGEVLQTTQDMEDEWETEMKQFTPASRITGK